MRTRSGPTRTSRPRFDCVTRGKPHEPKDDVHVAALHVLADSQTSRIGIHFIFFKRRFRLAENVTPECEHAGPAASAAGGATRAYTVRRSSRRAGGQWGVALAAPPAVISPELLILCRFESTTRVEGTTEQCDTHGGPLARNATRPQRVWRAEAARSESALEPGGLGGAGRR